MRLHPRHDLVTRAQIDIQQSVTAAVSRHSDVTCAELTDILLGIATYWNSCAIRDEREADSLEATGAHDRPDRCHAGRDGECNWKDCPQIRDKEPEATGRHCPLDVWEDED